MKERKTYIGKVNGVAGIFCDIKPENIELEKEITFYSPDSGYVFTKDGELFDSVVLKDDEKIENYIEIKDIRNLQEPEKNNE